MLLNVWVLRLTTEVRKRDRHVRTNSVHSTALGGFLLDG
jgi:hypothetical protein